MISAVDGSITAYDLFGAGDSSLGRLFYNRKFDVGMVAFLVLIGELASQATVRDPAFALPYRSTSLSFFFKTIVLLYGSSTDIKRMGVKAYGKTRLVTLASNCIIAMMRHGRLPVAIYWPICATCNIGSRNTRRSSEPLQRAKDSAVVASLSPLSYHSMRVAAVVHSLGRQGTAWPPQIGLLLVCT